MKNKLLHFLFIILLGFPSPLHAQTAKVITLKDGSVLKGEVLKLDNGVYTVQTLNMGEIQIAEKEIVRIDAAPQTAPADDIGAQAQQVQTQILTDPELMQEVQNMLQDEKTVSILSDPQLMKDVLSRDPAKIEGNKDIQTLINNPHMQNLMEKINQKFPAQK